MANRKTAKDWRKAYADAKIEVEKLENQISARLLELTKKYPDAIVLNVGGTPIKAKSIGCERYIKSMELSIQTLCIEKIEEHITSLHPHKQLEIDYASVQVHATAPVGVRAMLDGRTGILFSRTKEDPICNCDGRDMPLYKDGGKLWCPQCGYEVK